MAITAVGNDDGTQELGGRVVLIHYEIWGVDFRTNDKYGLRKQAVDDEWRNQIQAGTRWYVVETVFSISRRETNEIWLKGQIRRNQHSHARCRHLHEEGDYCLSLIWRKLRGRALLTNH
jgi:hypothetical protein